MGANLKPIAGEVDIKPSEEGIENLLSPFMGRAKSLEKGLLAKFSRTSGFGE